VDTTITGPAGVPAQYTFAGDTGDDHAAQQRRVLAEILDADSISVLSQLDIPPGARCLDVGAGAGTITAWLAEKATPAGHVTALDLNTSQIPARTNVTALTGDVRTTDLPEASFDLVHARAVLVFLPDREQVLRRLATALRPGGVIVISDWTDPTTRTLLHAPSPAAAQAYETYQTLVPAIMLANGADTSWGPRVPIAMRDCDLTDVNTVVHNRLWYGGQAGHLLHLHNSYLLQDALLARGMTTDQLDLLRAAVTDSQTMAYLFPMHTTTGRRATEQ
jgi:SAM-dependent methyltransferase